MPLEATQAMAKDMRKTCTGCHSSPKGGEPGKPKLNNFGIRYLTNIIRKEAYVPLNPYRQLNHLSKEIAENKRKAAEKKEEEKKAEQLAAASTPKTTSEADSSTATMPAGAVSPANPSASTASAKAETPNPAIGSEKPLTSNQSASADQPQGRELVTTTSGGKQLYSGSTMRASGDTAPKSSEAPSFFSRSVTRPVAPAEEKKEPVLSTEAVKPKDNLQVKPGDGIRFKGGKTFILKKQPKVVDVNYDWEDDWEFDDYY